MPPRILVVDDDPGLLRLLTIRLRAENYNVEAVDNGPAALAAASRFRPDLVISDLRMEPMDGIALLREMQESLARRESHFANSAWQHPGCRAGHATGRVFVFDQARGKAGTADARRKSVARLRFRG